MSQNVQETIFHFSCNNLQCQYTTLYENSQENIPTRCPVSGTYVLIEIPSHRYRYLVNTKRTLLRCPEHVCDLLHIYLIVFFVLTHCSQIESYHKTREFYRRFERQTRVSRLVRSPFYCLKTHWYNNTVITFVSRKSRNRRRSRKKRAYFSFWIFDRPLRPASSKPKNGFQEKNIQ